MKAIVESIKGLTYLGLFLASVAFGMGLLFGLVKWSFTAAYKIVA